MKVNEKLRNKLLIHLPKDYRKTIVERLAEQGITVHPNTVSNTLNGSSENDTVLNEILKLHNEEKEKTRSVHMELNKNLKQVSAA